jgi:hypothetical protein
MSITHGQNLRVLALEKELEKLKKQKKEKKEKYSHFVQMLIMEYLGIAKDIQNNYKRADIYAPIIGRDWETTRQYFSKLEGEKTEKNLKIVLEYFKKVGFKEQEEKVQKDLDKIIAKK